MDRELLFAVMMTYLSHLSPLFQYFQTTVTNEHRSQVGKMYGDVRDTFKLGVKQAPHPHARNSMGHGNVTITSVEWSPPQVGRGKVAGGDSGEDKGVRVDDSLVAAAGSNGVIAVWNAKQAFFSEGSGESSTLANQQPEAILSQEHTRAVNSLAWHPKRPGILISASQVSLSKTPIVLLVSTVILTFCNVSKGFYCQAVGTT